jgi:nitroreductase
MAANGTGVAVASSWMDAMAALLTRASAKRTTEPAPEGEDLDLILRAAVRAPDHGRLAPWRFVLVRGPARERLGQVFAEALLGRDPAADQDSLDRERARPLRAPLLVVVVSRVREDMPKVPVVEQLLSVGAAAQNILLAAHALGYGGMWRTGPPAYDPIVQRALGVGEGEAIAGFLYLGTATEAPVPPPGPAGSVVSEWVGYEGA